MLMYTKKSVTDASNSKEIHEINLPKLNILKSSPKTKKKWQLSKLNFDFGGQEETRLLRRQWTLHLVITGDEESRGELR